MKYSKLVLLPMLFFVALGCSKNPLTPSAASGSVFMWIAPVADTKVDSDYPDQNFSDAGDNTFARAHIPGLAAWHVTSYVKFQLPVLPAGTKIDEAYFEMFHSGTTEDGTPDNTRFDVSTVGSKWNAKAITWNNGPDRGVVTSGVNPIGVILHSDDWCGTKDISDTIRLWFADSSYNTGFRITIGDQQNFFKSFYSNNSFIGSNNSGGRTDSTVGKAPRLLVKIELPAGMTTKDIAWDLLRMTAILKLDRTLYLMESYGWLIIKPLPIGRQPGE